MCNATLTSKYCYVDYKIEDSSQGTYCTYGTHIVNCRYNADTAQTVLVLDINGASLGCQSTSSTHHLELSWCNEFGTCLCPKDLCNTPGYALANLERVIKGSYINHWAAIVTIKLLLNISSTVL